MTTGIFKRPKSKFWWIRYTDQHGKVHKESSQSEKFSVAQKRLNDRRKAIDDGKEIEAERAKIRRYTFGQLAEKYVAHCKVQKGYEKKASVVRQLNDRYAATPLKNFSTVMLELHQTEMLTAPRPTGKFKDGKEIFLKPYAFATVNRHFGTIKHMFTKAVDWDMVGEDTKKRVYRVKQLKEENERVRFLTREEISTLLSRCSDHLRPMVILALNTGMRKGEIFKLKWSQVDLKNRIISLDAKAVKEKRRRNIGLNDAAAAALASVPHRIDIPWVFASTDKKKKDTHVVDVKKSFAAACKKAGIVDFHFHDLRHTFASHLVMGNVNLTTVKDLMGHADLKMTLRYAHLAPKHLSDAVNVLDNAFAVLA